MSTSSTRGGASVARTATATLNTSQALSDFVHAILRDNGSELDVVEEVASMLGDMRPLMRANIESQVGNLQTGQQDRVTRIDLQRAIFGQITGRHEQGSLLENTRTRTYMAVCKVFNAQQWPVTEADELASARYGPHDPRWMPATWDRRAPMTPEAQIAMLQSLLEAVEFVIQEVAGVLAAKRRLRRPSARHQQDESSAITDGPTSTSISASTTTRARPTRPSSTVELSSTARPTFVSGPAPATGASSTRRPASISGPATTATPASENGAGVSRAVADQDNTSTKSKSSAVDQPQSSQRSRAQAANAPWSAKETLAVAVAWWDGKLEQDAAKRSGHSTVARVAQHDQWIRTHGTELQVKPGDRSWDALDQRVRNLRKAGTTLAEIQAQAAEEQRRAGQR
ncbi:hypothetical protein LTR02_001835 [Friedmanniomyces endolithicus]|nr:hypothetical protein LTR94_000252 [Friedmanniomyces endolithicus]KAK0814969.1 hypothetical protein LTR59_000724 [Friedmanniomyces endolithicus]KAK0815199.1 hypothetical protein LTR38_002493 [Friedmanniomyces endolithicus]KAK0838669.1 hypothetical protein LTR03_011847 [Friedmanniomyces endolithicus]KAK0876010.1 hypothetical protein LTR87_010163 [Friedmanniomyces endolithicus]